MDINRRDFFAGTWLREALTTPTLEAEVTKEAPPAFADDYFSSIETCYAFLSEVPLEDLQQEAVQRGAPYEGLSKFELAKSLFSGGQYRELQK